MTHTITAIETYLVSEPVPAGIADATRAVGAVGFTVVRVRTSEGLEGIGFTYNEVGGAATRTLLDTTIGPALIGRDPLATEDIWTDLVGYLRGVGRKGLLFGALSAVDVALWDLKGKITGLPLFRLLGGSQTRVPVYASGGWTSYSDQQLLDEVTGMLSSGYTAVKIKVGVEGGTNLRRDVRRVTAVREMAGPGVQIMLDANNCWDAARAIQFAGMIRDLDILFLEEPVIADDIPGLARFRRSTGIPLATGEHEYTRYGARDLIRAEAADVVQLDGARAGGYTEMLKVAALTQAWNLKLAPHAMEHLHLHLVSAAPNALFVERLLMFEEVTHRLFAGAPEPVGGFLTIPDRPGLGLELDESYLKAQPS
ncbi:mandelate racemase/muconate lactonizing enzyme family protein [Actinoplanes bogorensis]|uniref:Mandelate racemase/muconate lactonizing enzyme family protein n=1 Tax=Paractinoplanes bogorensis TaxID=1610840 RepID=A0ABS5YJI5_9ACTN|nr:mandelate racemase/muconate lactonizing enzyme family protein [Actinoplanes bogorensis]MBU2663620.1 mandelate racemase/muconate lactonizing enzyme family protein [Actinoplanes bogorensis]